MHYFDLHITTTQNTDKIFSAVHRVVCRNDYGTVFWSITEGEKTEMGLVVYKEKKVRVKEDVGLVLEKMGVRDFCFVHPIKQEVTPYWYLFYMPKEYERRFA